MWNVRGTSTAAKSVRVTAPETSSVVTGLDSMLQQRGGKTTATDSMG